MHVDIENKKLQYNELVEKQISEDHTKNRVINKQEGEKATKFFCLLEKTAMPKIIFQN